MGRGDNPVAVLAAADNPDANTKRRQACEANFFITELALCPAVHGLTLPNFSTVARLVLFCSLKGRNI